MPRKFRGLVYMDSVVLEGYTLDHGTAPTPNSAGSVTLQKFSRPPQLCKFDLAGAVVSMAAADDFGSLKLCDLPNANLTIIGARVSFVGTLAGFTADVGTNLDVAVGTVATASAAFSNAGEKDIVPKIDGTGAGATVTVAGRGTATEDLLFIAAGASNAVYLNASQPVASGTGTLTITSGYVELLIQYHD